MPLYLGAFKQHRKFTPSVLLWEWSGVCWLCDLFKQPSSVIKCISHLCVALNLHLGDVLVKLLSQKKLKISRQQTISATFDLTKPDDSPARKQPQTGALNPTQLKAPADPGALRAALAPGSAVCS